MKNKSDIDYTLYLVTDRGLLNDISLEYAVEESIKGGVTLVQLREKDISTLEFYNIAVKVKKITDKYNIPFIINDRIDIALAVNADGVHVGQSDMPAREARRIIGNDKILGVSANNINDAIKAENDGADYIGSGAIFPTDTKKDADIVSIKELYEIKSLIKIPLVAIGGISENNVDKLSDTRIDGISVISAILGKKDVKKASENLINHMKKFK